MTILISIDRFGSTWGQWFFAEFALFALPMGLFVGGIVGVAIWLVQMKRTIGLGFVQRFVVGSLIGVTPWLIDFWLTNRSGYMAIPWQIELRDALLFAGTIGGLPGLICERQN